MKALIEALLQAGSRRRSSAEAERPGCDAGCAAPAAFEVDAARADDRRRYCTVHAQRLRIATAGRKRLRRLERCAWCGQWAASDLHLQRARHARPLCGRCAEIVEELGEAMQR